MKKLFLLFVLLISIHLWTHAQQDMVTFAGGSSANTKFNDVVQLSNGNYLVAGSTKDLSWINPQSPKVKFSKIFTGQDYGKDSTNTFGVLLYFSSDMKTMLNAFYFDKEASGGIDFIKTTNVPGQTTGSIFISFGKRNLDTAHYFIAKLDNNFVDGTPTDLQYYPFYAGRIIGETYRQAWDVDASGNVIYETKWDDNKYSELRKTNATYSYGNLLVSNWNNPLRLSINTTTGDFRSWTSTDYNANVPDGKGGFNKGKYPADAFFTGPYCATGTCNSFPGYQGSKWNTNPIGSYFTSVCIDRRNGNMYFGMVFSTNNGGIPDYEPAVMAQDATGSILWWSRLYSEGNGTCMSDQYIDGLAIDYANNQLVVNARTHGNAANNFWSSNNAFQKAFTGGNTNIHISWLGKLSLSSGAFTSGTYVGEMLDGVNQYGSALTDPNLDGWSDPNFAATTLNTTYLEKNRLRVATDGSVAVVGIGKRPRTTANAYMKVPKPDELLYYKWTDFVRIYNSDFSTITYSTTLANPTININASNNHCADFKSIFPTNTGFVAVGNNELGYVEETTNVPSWGEASTVSSAVLMKISTNPCPITPNMIMSATTCEPTIQVFHQNANVAYQYQWITQKSQFNDPLVGEIKTYTSISPIIKLNPDNTPTYVRMVVSNGTCSVYDDVIITRISGTTEQLPDVHVCNSTTTINATAPGNGVWSLVQGSGVLASYTNASTTVVGLNSTFANRFKWTVNGGSCTLIQNIDVYNDKPTTPNAGVNLTICMNNAFLNANNISIGTSWWSVVSGSGTFVNPSQRNTQVTALQQGTSVFRWNASKNGCSLHDDVTVSSYYFQSNAGSNQIVCYPNTTIAAIPNVGTKGIWSVVTGSALIQNPSMANTTVDNLHTGTNTLRWTETKDVCSSFAEIQITNLYEEPYAGSDQIRCTFSTTLNAISPSISKGSWSVLQGNGIFTTPSQYNTTVNGLSDGLNVFRWTLTNGGCVFSDDVNITNDSPSNPDIANPYQSLCTTTANLVAATPVVGMGTGRWSSLGAAIITNPTLNNTTVTNLSSGTNILRWTVSKSGCTLFEDATITNNAIIADAGIAQVVCETTAGLIAGQLKTNESGKWTLGSGNGTFSNSTNSVTTVSGLYPGYNRFLWTVTKGSCQASAYAEVYSNYFEVSAGVDMTTCSSSVQLDGEIVVNATSQKWEILSGVGKLLDGNNPKTILYDINYGRNDVSFTTVKNSCEASNVIQITRNDCNNATGSIALTPAQQYVGGSVGATFDVDVVVGNPTAISSPTNFYGTAFNVNWNHAGVKLLGYTTDQSWLGSNQWASIYTFNNQHAEMTVTKNNLSGNTGTGTILKLKFQFTQTIANSSAVRIWFSDIQSTQANGDALTLTPVGEAIVNLGLLVWPGDADNNKIVNSQDILPVGYYYNVTGTPRTEKGNTWKGMLATPFAITQATYADCNGDGIIKNSDVLTIGLNAGKTHAKSKIEHTFVNLESAIQPSFVYEIYNLANQKVNAKDIKAGEEFNLVVKIQNVSENNILGVSFGVKWENNAVEIVETVGDKGVIVGNVWSTNPLNLNILQKNEQTLESGIVDFNQKVLTNDGEVSRIRMKMLKPSGNITTLEPIAMNNKGEYLVVTPATINMQTSVDELDLQSLSLQTYPNPFTEYTNIEFTLHQPSHISISIYDIFGRKIENLMAANLSQGNHKCVWNAKGKAKGVYFVKLENEKTQITKKLILK